MAPPPHPPPAHPPVRRPGLELQPHHLPPSRRTTPPLPPHQAHPSTHPTSTTDRQHQHLSGRSQQHLTHHSYRPPRPPRGARKAHRRYPHKRRCNKIPTSRPDHPSPQNPPTRHRRPQPRRPPLRKTHHHPLPPDRFPPPGPRKAPRRRHHPCRGRGTQLAVISAAEFKRRRCDLESIRRRGDRGVVAAPILLDGIGFTLESHCILRRIGKGGGEWLDRTKSEAGNEDCRRD